MPKQPKKVHQDDALVTTHSGVDVFLDAEGGQFYCELEGRSQLTKSSKLATLKLAITNAQREEARARAGKLPVVAMTGRSGWRDEDSSYSFLYGTFAGINAHTGDPRILLSRGAGDYRKAGDVVELSDHARFIRAAEGDEVVPEIRRLVTQVNETRRTHEKAREMLDAYLKKHAHQVHVSLGGRNVNRSERAAEAEEALIKFLGEAP